MNADTSRINDDPLAKLIVEICLVMRTDFGRQFSVQFRTEDDLRQYKRRLYTKLRGFDVNDVADGYELFVDGGKAFCPTIPELIEHVELAQKQRRQRELAAADVQRVTALPAPTIQCDPLKMLAEAKRAAMTRRGGPSLADRLKSHEALLKSHAKNIKTREFGPDKCCDVGHCKNPGALSHGTTGSGPFYCAKHYRQSG
jgi:hypothetical protein